MGVVELPIRADVVAPQMLKLLHGDQAFWLPSADTEGDHPWIG